MMQKQLEGEEKEKEDKNFLLRAVHNYQHRYFHAETNRAKQHQDISKGKGKGKDKGKGKGKGGAAVAVNACCRAFYKLKEVMDQPLLLPCSSPSVSSPPAPSPSLSTAHSLPTDSQRVLGMTLGEAWLRPGSRAIDIGSSPGTVH